MDVDLEHITAIATSVAALAACWASWQASKATRATADLVAIERDRRADEERRQRSAELTVTTVTRSIEWGSSRQNRLMVVVTNLGPAAASDVNLTDPSHDGSLGGRLTLDAFPVAALGPGSNVEAQSQMTFGDSPVVDLELEWTDGNGRRSEVRTVHLV